MRTIKNRSYFFFKIATVISLTAFISCKKKSGDTTPPPTPMGVVGIHLHTNIDTTEVDTGVVSVDATGRKIKLKIAQFYAYNFVAKKTDGSSTTLSNYVLKTIGTEMYVLGSVPAGNYTSISFNVGVDATNNSKAPSTCSASSPLYTQIPAMWFGSTSQGYIFMNVQGTADTSASQTASVNQYQPFSYQLGTSAMLKTITLPNMTTPLSVTTNATSSAPALFHVICDYGKLLSGVNFKTQNAATPFSNATLANQIAGNITTMFRYE